MKQETRNVWVAEDGKVFDTAAACEAHEAEQFKRKSAIARLKVYRVTHGFDETEGRGYFAQTLIITDASKPVLLQWCLDTLGSPLSGWYGDGFFEAWHLSEANIDPADALGQAGKISYSYQSPTKLAVISKSDWTAFGLPKSDFPWPRPKKGEKP